jgi:hypothetical protein
MKFRVMETTDNDKKENIDTGKKIMRHGGGEFGFRLGFIRGGALLMRQLGFDMPGWLFSWQMILIVIGIFSGLAHAFSGPGWLIMILIGTFFLFDQSIPGLNIHKFIWPAVIILVGLIMLIRPKRSPWMDHNWHHGRWNRRNYERWQRRRARGVIPDMGGYPGGEIQSRKSKCRFHHRFFQWYGL